MKILTNKFFIFGNLLLILLAIPLTLYFVKRQQDLRSKAAPSSTLSFQPSAKTTSSTCPSSSIDVMLDPGTNLVSFVDLYITYDPNAITVTQLTPSTTFSTVQRPASITSGAANIELDAVGGDVTKAVSTPSKVATIVFTPKTAGTSQIQIDQSKSQVLSLSSADQPYENVLSSATPANLTIDSNACTDTSVTPGISTITPTISAGVITTPPAGTGAGTGSATLTPTVAVPTPTVVIPTATLIPTAVPTSPPAAAAPTVPPTGGIGQTIGIIAGIIATLGVGFLLLAL